jgi:Arc/MetJ-type ribon-helix-helix transcriptional regulator
MKVSVSLPTEDVEFLDDYARARGIDSRSAALHKAVRLLRFSELGGAYEEAWHDWKGAGEADAWEASASDGIEG